VGYQNVRMQKFAEILRFPHKQAYGLISETIQRIYRKNYENWHFRADFSRFLSQPVKIFQHPYKSL
jgi:hypothetical protein